MADINFEDFFADSKKQVKTVAMPDGTEIEIPSLEFFPDAFFEAARNENHLEMAKVALGDNYDSWVANGGTSMQFLRILAELSGVTIPNLAAS